MKQIIVLLGCILTLPKFCTAQSTSKPIKSKDFSEVVVTHKPLNKANHKVWHSNIHYIFRPQNVIRPIYDSMFFATHIPSIDTGVVLLSSVELKLASFDTSKIDLLFFVYQENTKDTLFYSQKIDITQLGKHNKLRLYLDQQQHLQPNQFYLGYNFHLKNIGPEGYDYRLYSNLSKKGAVMFEKKPSGKLEANPDEERESFSFKIFYFKP